MAIKITVSLDDDVRAGLDAEKRESGKSFKETVNEMLRLGLLSRERARESKPFKVRAKDLGL